MRPLKSPVRSDPAPSRWSYRVQRWLLTPAFRRMLRTGIPLVLIAGLLAGLFGDAERRAVMAASIQELRRQVETRPEFMVNLLAVEGASPAVETDIRELFPTDLPASSFDIDLNATRQMIVSLPAVADASVRVRQGGILVASVTERQPVAIWRTRGGLSLLDVDGVAIGPVLYRSNRPELPIVAGPGADRAVAEALGLLEAAAPIADRVRGLVRVGERRWDLVLDRGQRVLLPEDKPVRALERVIVLADLQDLLERDLGVVDMRLPGRPTIRLSEHAMSELWRITRTRAGQTTGIDQ
ncbi:MAG: cell division protein FtsQ/DivIB [Pseudomonadota bacterium]